MTSCWHLCQLTTPDLLVYLNFSSCRWDEEAARDYWIARMQLACLQAADQMHALEQVCSVAYS